MYAADGEEPVCRISPCKIILYNKMHNKSFGEKIVFFMET